KNLLPPTSGPTPQPPQFFVSDVNSTANTAAAPDGMATVQSVVRNGWLIGCAPTGSLCPATSPRAVEQIVARVASSSTVRGAGLPINGAAVDCATGSDLPNGVSCQQTLLDGGQLIKWSVQFEADGIYRLNTTVTATDDGAGSVGREVKVDLHDPVGPAASPQSS